MRLFIIFLFLFFVVTPKVRAQDYTLIINQVRGEECCEKGNIQFLKNQISKLDEKNLRGIFVVRYDALIDKQYQDVLISASKNHEIGAFLEITPSLAGDLYKGQLDAWYVAGSAFLVGYTPDQRKIIIDKYMNNFYEVFGFYPKTTASWMIDTYSLKYLKENYGVTMHEITREEWNTDSTTLYGGPEHYPYYPSENWTFIPTATDSGKMPLIVRQTISDPVENFGDEDGTHTSQPNDYIKGGKNFDYFKFLFNQARNQPNNPDTFMVLGLENSMAEKFQTDFLKEIEYVTKTGLDGYKPQLISVYEGSKYNDPSIKAWWITTPKYKIRLRLEKNNLYVDDLRSYSNELIDPYLNQPSSEFAFWITPFSVNKPILLKSNIKSLEVKRNNDQITFENASKIIALFDADKYSLPIKIDQKTYDKNIRNNPLLFPQLKNAPVDNTKSWLYTNNKFALVGKNPIRIIFYPRDAENFPVDASRNIKITTNPKIDNIQINSRDKYGGSIYVDLVSDTPRSVVVTIDDFFKTTVYFSLDCKRNLSSCLRHPSNFIWYLGSLLSQIKI